MMTTRKRYVGLDEMPDFDQSWVPSSSLQKVSGNCIVAIPNEGSNAVNLLNGYGIKDEAVLIKNLLEIDGGSIEADVSTITIEDHYSLQLEMEGVVDGMCAAAHRGIKYGDDGERFV